MTKDWDNYKETILALYEHQTLATVMEILKRDYNFVASTRAYRQKLDKWGKRKYKKRKGKSDNSLEESDADSADEAAESSTPGSPEGASHRNVNTNAHQTNIGHGAGAHIVFSTFHHDDANYSFSRPGPDVSNEYNYASQYPGTLYAATDNTYWPGFTATAAHGFSQATPDPNAVIYAAATDGGYNAYDGVGVSLATPFPYFDASGFPILNHPLLEYSTYPEHQAHGVWDHHTQDG